MKATVYFTGSNDESRNVNTIKKGDIYAVKIKNQITELNTIEYFKNAFDESECVLHIEREKLSKKFKENKPFAFFSEKTKKLYFMPFNRKAKTNYQWYVETESSLFRIKLNSEFNAIHFKRFKE